MSTHQWRPKICRHRKFVGAQPRSIENRPRIFTTAHADLIETFGELPSEPWSRCALRSCLEWLASSSATEAWSVAVENAWVEGEWTFCVVYEYAYFDGRLGCRLTARDARDETGSIGDAYGDDQLRARDPVEFGRDAADFDIGEPLGTIADGLRPAPDGIYWWGEPTAT